MKDKKDKSTLRKGNEVNQLRKSAKFGLKSVVYGDLLNVRTTLCVGPADRLGHVDRSRGILFRTTERSRHTRPRTKST